MENFIEGNAENFEDLISSDKLTIVDFWAPWCNPCRTQLPILQNFATKNEDTQVVKINVDENSDLAKNYEVRSIPTIIYFKNGELKHRTVGVQNDEQLEEIKTQYND